MSEGNIPEPDSSLEMQRVEGAVSSHPDEPPTEASGDNPMEVADDPNKEQAEKLDSPQDPKDKSRLAVITAKSQSKLTSPSKSAVKVASPIRGKRPSPSKPPQDVHSPSKKQSLDVKTTDQTTKEVSSSGAFVAEKVKSPVKRKRQSPSKPPQDVHHSPSKMQSLEVITTDQTTMEVSSSNEFVAENSNFSSQATKASSEGENNSEVSQASAHPSNTSNVSIAGVSQASSDPSDSSNVSIAGVSQASSDLSDSSNASIAGVSQASSNPSDPSHVCVETCIHGGARPKTRTLTTVQRSSEQEESSKVLKQMNRFAERMERSFSPNPEYFGNGSQQDWTRKIDNTNVFAEELAGEMGHGPFVHSSANTEYPYYFPSILQLHRMFTGLSLENMNVPETGTPQRMDTEQQPHPSQNFFQQEPTISIDQVPESTRPMDVDEVLSSSFPSWQAPEPEAPVNPMDQQEPPNEQEVKAAQEEPQQQQPRQEYRLMRLAMRVPQMGPYIINPSHPYRHRDENMWRTAMMTAYRSERYHSKEALDDAMSQLEREGVSQEDFFRFYHSARRIDLFRDEGVEEIRSEPEREEITIEDKINRIIIAVGFMTVAMLYMRLYIAHHPEIETSSESSTMDSGNVDRSESEPKTDYARLREHVNIDLGSSDNTDSPKGIGSPDNNSPQEIQSPDFVPIPNRGSPVNVLVPLSQVPKRSDSPSSQGSLLAESDPSGSSSSKKGQTLRRAVLGKCHSQSLDNTSGDASPIQPDEEEAKEGERSFGQLMNVCLQSVFRVPDEGESPEVENRAESVEDEKKKDPGVDEETGEAPSDKDRDSEGVVDPAKTAGDEEDRTEADPASPTPDEVSKNDSLEGGARETSLSEEKMDQSEDVSMESSSEEKGGMESDENKEEKGGMESDEHKEEKGGMECAEHKEETDDASESSDKVGDDSKTGDLGGKASKSGKKRKESSNIEEERLAKRGKEY